MRGAAYSLQVKSCLHALRPHRGRLRRDRLQFLSTRPGQPLPLRKYQAEMRQKTIFSLF